jgi:hypothetical protein
VDSDGSDLGLRVCVVAGLRPAIGPEARHHTSRFCPHAGKPGQPLSRNAEIAASADQHFLQPSNLINRAKRLASLWGADTPVRESTGTQITIKRSQVRSEIKDRIPDQLSRPVKCNVPAAVALEHLDVTGRQRIRRSEHVSSFGIAPKSDDGRMFQQQQHIWDLAGLAQINQLPLQPKSFAIINLTELDDRNHVAVEIIGPPGG